MSQYAYEQQGIYHPCYTSTHIGRPRYLLSWVVASMRILIMLVKFSNYDNYFYIYTKN